MLKAFNLCPSTDEWINEVWYIHTMEYYSTVKRNEIPIEADTKGHILYDSIYMKYKCDSIAHFKMATIVNFLVLCI